MRLLVTGSAGFIGCNFVREILETRPGWTIVSFDKLSYAGNLANLDGLDAKRHSFVRGDIAVAADVARAFERGPFDAMVHFAAESHVDRSIESGDEFARSNVLGTQVLLSASRKAKLGRFVHVSTDEVYGSLGPTGKFVETMPLDPTSPYAASKAASDLMVLAHIKTHKMPALITRCSNNYGPYQFPEKAIPLFVTNALQDKPLPVYGDGSNVREWLHVRDHARAILAVLEKGRDGEVYNIGSGEERKNIDLAKLILKTLGKPESLINFVTDRLAHDRRYAIDNSKIKRELGWSPAVGFEDGIRDTIAWYRANEPWWRDILSGNYRARNERG
ncbi:MAG TPA: dTDP-glucose 4,6-dehydratase [bacterium]|nr:dTDP-glucose 4,6-dehydratase [bacterium]